MGSPVAMAVKRSPSDDAGRPAPSAALVTLDDNVEFSLLLTMTLTTAEPKAPPIALAENASPVALARY